MSKIYQWVKNIRIDPLMLMCLVLISIMLITTYCYSKPIEEAMTTSQYNIHELYRNKHLSYYHNQNQQNEEDDQNKESQSVNKNENEYIIPTKWGNYSLSQKDIECLYLNAYHEARGTGIKGIAAVMMVTVNRAASQHMGVTSVCDAVYAKKQFSWTNQPQSKKMSISQFNWSDKLNLEKALYQLVSGKIIKGLEKALYYHADYVSPYWSDGQRSVASISGHVFYNQIKPVQIQQVHQHQEQYV